MNQTKKLAPLCNSSRFISVNEWTLCIFNVYICSYEMSALFVYDLNRSRNYTEKESSPQSSSNTAYPVVPYRPGSTSVVPYMPGSTSVVRIPGTSRSKQRHYSIPRIDNGDSYTPSQGVDQFANSDYAPDGSSGYYEPFSAADAVSEEDNLYGTNTGNVQLTPNGYEQYPDVDQPPTSVNRNSGSRGATSDLIQTLTRQLEEALKIVADLNTNVQSNSKRLEQMDAYLTSISPALTQLLQMVPGTASGAQQT